MKNSMIEKQLKNELAANTPSDFEGVWAKCQQTQPVLLAEQATEKQTVIGTVEGKKKIGMSFWALLLAAVLFCSVLLFSFLNGTWCDTSLRFKRGSFLFDVNPSVEVFYNDDGNVTEIKGLNEDGKALLVGVSLVGRKYDEAADILFDRCVKMGYFAAVRENNALLVTAVSEDGTKDSSMTTALKNTLIKEFSDNKMRGVVITGVYNSTLSEAAQKYGIDAQKYGLILSYLSNGGELAEEEYATISIRGLYELLDAQEKELKRIKTQESKTILKNFEKELQETLSEQIDVLLSTLDVYMPLPDEEESVATGEIGKFDTLKEYAEGLENATNRSQRKDLIDKILAELNRLKESEEDAMIKQLIEGAKVSISVTYDFFENAQ